MDRLRGSGSTFSTSGKSWVPFRGNPKIASHNGRLHRLKQAGLIKPLTKDDMRRQAEQAVAGKPIT